MRAWLKRKDNVNIFNRINWKMPQLFSNLSSLCVDTYQSYSVIESLDRRDRENVEELPKSENRRSLLFNPWLAEIDAFQLNMNANLKGGSNRRLSLAINN